MKYMMWTISTIRDILSYNEHEILVGKPLDRIEKELLIIEEKKIDYSSDDFEKFFSDLLELGISLLPTTEKAIKKFGD